MTFRPPRREPVSLDLEDGACVADLVAAVDEPLHVVVALRKGQIVAEDGTLVDGDEITLLSAASGG